MNEHPLPCPILDTHLHVWDLDRFRYPWLDDIPFLNRSFSLEDYNAACGPLEVDRMVFVQCECEPAQSRQEAAWITKLARQDPRIQGIVAWAPLENGQAARKDLEALKEANPLLCGIRRIIQFEDDLEFCLRPDFIEGVRLLNEFGLTFDICIDHRHGAEAARMAEQIPDVRMIVDHIGKPPIAAGDFEPWATHLAKLAARPNVWCKVSSLATEADHDHWSEQDLKPYVDHVFEHFGFDRTVFAGDWPVSSLAADLPTCVQTLLNLVGDRASEDDLRALFRDNGNRFYGLTA